jgi:2-polyprenyl-3-methyl-5-hydroxy-6-metoxy-1,4-benzoquinol methylase
LDILLEAAGVFCDSKADTLVSLDEQGEETAEFAFYRDSFLSRHGPNREGDRSRCFPFVVRGRGSPFAKGKQAEEAESYRDRIGDRLMNPERVDREMRHLIEDDIRRVDRVLALPFGKRVLDVGCSDGTVTLMVAERWACEEVIGVDIAASAVAEARANAQKKEMQQTVKFFASFIEDLDYPDQAFDTVSATETLEHVAPGQFAPCLRNLVRMVRPTGNLIVTVPNRYPDPSYVAQKRDRWRWPAHHHFFGRFKLAYLLSSFFARVEFFPHDDACPPERGIYLISCCWERKGRNGCG